MLFADPAVGRLYAHDSPYTYFTSDELHLGEISLECSRAGAAAAALWTTLRALPADARRARPRTSARGPAAGSALAARARRRRAARARRGARARHRLPFARAPSASAISAASERAFDTLAEQGWHVAKLRSTRPGCAAATRWIEADAESTTVLRCCLMKPEHVDVADELAAALTAALAT